MKKITILPEHRKRIQSRLNPRVRAKEDLMRKKRRLSNISVYDVIAVLALIAFIQVICLLFIVIKESLI